jgi:two-component system response regulator NreC
LNKKWPKKPPRRTMEMTMEIRILVVDNHRIVREAICSRLSSEPGMDIVGEAEDGRIAIQLARELNPDVIIMETSMPNLNGIEATRQIVNEIPDVKVVALSAHWDRRSVCEMLKAGASGYLPKRCAFQELVSAIQNVVSNRTYLSSHISGLVVDEYLHRSVEHGQSAYSILTDREREVLQLIAEGKSTKRIARELFVSPKTIEWHRSQLMKKLRIESVAELVKYAISEGLTSVAYA